MQLRNKKWTLEEFLQERAKVLASWKTGSDIDLDLERAVENLKNVPEHKNFAKVLEKQK